ncbi:MAG: hypothetical protein WDA41_09995, partial [Candidatus Neomarinimicrobiota bacterium]
MPRDLLAEQNEPRDLLAEPEDTNELSFRQGVEPDFIDKVFSFFRDPQKEKARATLALVDSEALGINPHTAYNAKKAIDKYYDIDPTRKKAKEDKLQRIKAFNDMGGEEEEWHTLFLRNVQKFPYHMMDAAGNWIRMFEENPEAAFAMTGATPSEEDLQTFKLATEAIEKKKVRTLGDDIAGAAKEKIKSLTPATAPDSWKDTVHMAGDSVMTNLVWLIPGFKYGKAASLTGMGWQATGQQYGQQREGGSDPGTAFAAATIGGMSEVLSEFIPVGIYLKPKASFIRSLVAAEFTEIPTEMANQVVQDVVDKVTIRPDMTIEDMIDNLTQTIQVTALSTLALSGMSYSANKAIGKATQRTEHADTFNQAKNKALRDGKTPQEAVKDGLDAVRSTPEGNAFIDQKEAEIRQAATDYKPTENKEPFIIGVNENKQGAVQSFTMADPVTGNTFEVPAIEKEGEKDTVKYIPDPEALKEEMDKIGNEDIDGKIDRLIEGDDTVIEQIYGKEVDVPDFQEEITPEENQKTLLDTVKSINDSLGEKGSIDLEPIVNLGRSIIAEGHRTYEAFTARAKELLGDAWEKVKELVEQAWKTLQNERGSVNIKSVTTKQGTADIPAKDKPQAEAGNPFKDSVVQERVTHGTDTEFDTFNFDSLGSNTMGNATDDAFIALSQVGAWFNDGAIKKAKNSPYTKYKEAYLDLKNPVKYSSIDEIAEEIRPYIKDHIVDDGYGGEGIDWKSVIKEWRDDTFYDDVDGIIVKDTEFGGTSYVVFSPDQIKLLPNPSRPPKGGVQLNDISSILNPEEIVNNLKGLTKNIKEAMPHLEALGRNIYESGKVKFNEWSAAMKETLGDLWESFKDVMNQVYEFTKRKLSEERGSISNKDAVNADPLFEIAKWIKDNGGLNYDSLIVDWGKEDVGILMKKRPGVVRKDGALKLDEVAQEWDT